MPHDDDYRSHFRRSNRVNRRQSKSMEKYARGKIGKVDTPGVPEVAKKLVSKMSKDMSKDMMYRAKRKKKKKKPSPYKSNKSTQASEDVFAEYMRMRRGRKK